MLCTLLSIPYYFSIFYTVIKAENGEGNGNLLQYSCRENPMDGGAWWAAIYGVAQSRTRPKWLSSSKAEEKKVHFCRTQQKQVFNYRKVLWLIKLNNKKTMKIPLHTFSEQPQSRTLTASNAGKVVHQLFIGRGSTKWYRHFGWQFGSFLQNKMTLGHTPSHCTSWYLPKCVESFCPHKNFLTDVYSSFIHNYQNLRSKIVPSGLPWWCIGKKSACQCRRHGFNPWFRRIPCATKQLSLCAITTLEPVSHNCWDHVPWQLKPKHPRALTPKQKKPP